MGSRTTDPHTGPMADRDHDPASDLRRAQQQLFALAEVARVYRDLVLSVLPTMGHGKHATQILAADTNLRDALLHVARMKRFT